jgi:hypothetical protein
MISPVTSATHAQPVVNSAPVKSESTQPKPEPAATDTVKISGAAMAALQEAMETPAQTAKEAGKGDRQAQRLLAKEAAAKAAVE